MQLGDHARRRGRARRRSASPRLTNSAAQADEGWASLLRGDRLPLFALLCLGVWLNAADALVTATIMPSVARDLGGYRYFAWATAGLLLGGIVAGASAGALAQRIGLKRGLVLAALTYAAGCVAGATAADIFPFITGRIVQGVGGGWLVGLVFVAISVLFPEFLWPRMFAAISSVWGAATLLGPLVGGLFAGAGLWRCAFWAFAAQAALMAVAVLVMLKRERRPDPVSRVPWPQLGVVLLAVCCVGGADMATSPLAAGALIGAGLVLVAFLLRADALTNRPLLPRAAGDLRGVVGAGYAMIFLLSAGSVAFGVYGAALLQAAYGLSPLQAGYVVGSEAVGWSVTAVLVSRASGAWQSGFIRLGGGILTFGMLALAVLLGRAPLFSIVAAALALGAGFGCCFAFVNGRVVGSLGEGERALGASAVPTAQNTGNAVGAAAAGAVANLLGLAGGITAHSAAAVAPILFGVFVPVAAAGWLASQTVARNQRAPMA